MATLTMEDTTRWLKSAAGLSISLTILIAVAATIDRGPYILVNTVIMVLLVSQPARKKGIRV